MDKLNIVDILEKLSNNERDRMWRDFFKYGRNDETLPEFLRRWLDGKL